MALTMPHASGEINTAGAGSPVGKKINAGQCDITATVDAADKRVINAARLVVRRLCAFGHYFARDRLVHAKLTY
jgi:hypothetical protein